jgi:competence protein ComEC
MITNRQLGLLLAVLIGVLLLALLEWQKLPSGKLQIHVFDVGQGDSLFIQSPQGYQIVIDGGPDMSLLEHLGAVMPWFDRSIDLLILSHFDADHITALPELLKRYDVEKILMTGTDHGSGRSEAVLHYIVQQGVPVVFPSQLDGLQLSDGLQMNVLWPHDVIVGLDVDEPNHHSIVMQFTYGNTSFLATGDIDIAAELEILRMGVDVRSTIMMAPHHGSNTSSSTGFILAVDPDYAVASAGKENRFGHPHQEVVTRYEALGVELLRTDEVGSVRFECDGIECLLLD